MQALSPAFQFDRCKSSFNSSFQSSLASFILWLCFFPFPQKQRSETNLRLPTFSYYQFGSVGLQRISYFSLLYQLLQLELIVSHLSRTNHNLVTHLLLTFFRCASALIKSSHNTTQTQKNMAQHICDKSGLIQGSISQVSLQIQGFVTTQNPGIHQRMMKYKKEFLRVKCLYVLPSRRWIIQNMGESVSKALNYEQVQDEVPADLFDSLLQPNFPEADRIDNHQRPNALQAHPNPISVSPNAFKDEGCPARMPPGKAKVPKCEPIDEECSICLLVMKKSHKIPKLACAHRFHFRCLRSWEKKSNLCPMCREEITPSFY